MDTCNRKRICTTLCVVSAALLACNSITRVESQDQLPAQFAQPQPQIQMPTSASFSSFFDPIVHTEDSELGGRKVVVHVPGLFDMILDTRANNQGMRMSQSVMKHVVQIYIDRMRDATGARMHGPISVRVFGWPVYQNSEAKATTVPVATPSEVMSHIPAPTA